MPNGGCDPIGGLVEPGRVHRRVYADPDVFELEMERIFGRAWLFVGHASQVANPGDYFTTELGRQPVVLTRNRDGAVYVLFNRCTHRGAKVVNERCGHATRMTCLYHGWSYDTDGALVGVPMPEGCAADFRKEAFGRSSRISTTSSTARPTACSPSTSACTATSSTGTGSCRSRTCSIPITCRSAMPPPSTRTASSLPGAKATSPAPRWSRP